MAKRICTTYSVSFRGVFGRNRSVKFVSDNACERTAGPDGVNVVALAADFVAKVQAKRGYVHVTRYDDSEDLGGGLYVIPITQGVIVYNEAM